jgi:1-acyl-sn-glycerol-3-phosphate acyltransferase
MGTFKAGSLKLATKSEAQIVPLTINGTYRMFEETMRFKPSDITLTIHPPVKTAGMSADEQNELPDKIQTIIKSALPDY